MRDILKPQSGTQSGTPKSSLKMVNFDDFWRGHQISSFFCACRFNTKFENFLKKTEKEFLENFFYFLIIFVQFSFFKYIRNRAFQYYSGPKGVKSIEK